VSETDKRRSENPVSRMTGASGGWEEAVRAKGERVLVALFCCFFLVGQGISDFLGIKKIQLRGFCCAV
jgi:hypothetical protein